MLGLNDPHKCFCSPGRLAIILATTIAQCCQQRLLCEAKRLLPNRSSHCSKRPQLYRTAFYSSYAASSTRSCTASTPPPPPLFCCSPSSCCLTYFSVLLSRGLIAHVLLVLSFVTYLFIRSTMVYGIYFITLSICTSTVILF